MFVFPTDRFKTVTLHAVYVQELTREDAAESALVPMVLRRGTRRHPTFTAMQAALDNLYGAHFRAEAGKIADKQLLSFHLEVPDGRFLPDRPDTVALGLQFLHDVTQDPALEQGRFPAGTVDQERELLRRQMLALINDKAQYAAVRLLETMADGRRFGLRRYGHVDDLAPITAESLTARWETVTRERPLWVFAVGAVDPKAVEQAVRSLWPGRRAQSPAPPELFTPRHHEHLVVESQPVEQGKLVLGYATGRRLTDPDYPALTMYAGVLGGFPHSKLFVNVRERQSLAYYAWARIDAALGLMIIASGIEFRDFDAALKTIRQQVEDMARGHIAEEEMAFTLRALRNDIRTEEDLPGSLIARQLERQLLGGGLSGAALEAALERVTVRDVSRVAEQVALDTIYFLTRTGEEPAQ